MSKRKKQTTVVKSENNVKSNNSVNSEVDLIQFFRDYANTVNSVLNQYELAKAKEC